MIEAVHVIKQMRQAAWEILRRSPSEKVAKSFVADVKAELDDALELARDKRAGAWAEKAAAEKAPAKKKAAGVAD